MAKDITIEKLDQILEVLQNLFILESTKVGVPAEEIRKILKINKNRIGPISKHIKG